MSNTFLYVLTVLMWGSTWFAIEFQLGVVAPEVSVMYRYAIASILLFIWCKIKDLPLSFKAKDHVWFVALGLFLFCLNYILADRAQVFITSALPVVQGNAWSMFYGGTLTGIFAVASGHEFNFDATFTYIGSLVYLAIFGSVVAFGAYLTLLGRIGAHKAGYATVMFPVVALILSIAFEGLKLDLSIAAGTGLVLLGNLLVLKKSS